MENPYSPPKSDSEDQPAKDDSKRLHIRYAVAVVVLAGILTIATAITFLFWRSLNR